MFDPMHALILTLIAALGIATLTGWPSGTVRALPVAGDMR